MGKGLEESWGKNDEITVVFREIPRGTLRILSRRWEELKVDLKWF